VVLVGEGVMMVNLAVLIGVDDLADTVDGVIDV
jgi:hypothetical protein